MISALLCTALLCAQTREASKAEGALRERVLAATPRMRVAARSTATAVVVGRLKDDLYLLTADHALDGSDTTVLGFEFFADAKAAIPAFVLKGAVAVVRKPVSDFALLKVAVEPGAAVIPLPLAAPGRNPKRYPFEGFSAGCSLGDPPTWSGETVLAKKLAVRREDEVAFFWQAEKTPARGRSGGPLVNAEGEVIGICAATSLGKGYYVHASEIQAVLKTEGFDWLWAPGAVK